MTIAFDPSKSLANIDDRGLAFELVKEFDWSTAIMEPSRTQELTATRFVAIGLIGSKIHVLVFTISPQGIRVISLRRAKKKERQRWFASQILT